jgi:hypothetical protein
MPYDLYLYFKEKPEDIVEFLNSLGFTKTSTCGNRELYQQDPKKNKTYTFKGNPHGSIFSVLCAEAAKTAITYSNAIDIGYYNETPEQEFMPESLKHENFVSWAEIQAYGMWDMLKNELENIAKKICEKYSTITYDPQIGKILTMKQKTSIT